MSYSSYFPQTFDVQNNSGEVRARGTFQLYRWAAGAGVWPTGWAGGWVWMRIWVSVFLSSSNLSGCLLRAMCWTVCSLPNSYVEVLTPASQNVTLFGSYGLWEVTKLKWGPRVGPNPFWRVSLWEEEVWTQETTDITHLHAQRKDHVRTDGRQLTTWKPRRELSEETRPADTSISRTVKIRISVVKPCNPGYYVMAAWLRHLGKLEQFLCLFLLFWWHPPWAQIGSRKRHNSQRQVSPAHWGYF